MRIKHQKKAAKLIIFTMFFMAHVEMQAMESKPRKMFSINSIDKILPLMQKEGINLKRSLFIFDFDETLARTVVSYRDTKFFLIANKERQRVYQEVTSKILAELNLVGVCGDGDFVSEHQYFFEESCEPLEAGTCEEIKKLKAEKAKMIICSGIDISFRQGRTSMIELINKFGLSFYCVKGNKIQVLENENFSQVHNLKDIDNIILVDNNDKYGASSIATFLEEARSYEFRDKSFYGIHLTVFDEMHSPAAVKKEYETLRTLMLLNQAEVVSEYASCFTSSE